MEGLPCGKVPHGHHENEHNDIQYSDTQYNDTQNNARVLFCHVIYAECYKLAPSAECCYVECHYAECHHAECHGALFRKVWYSSLFHQCWQLIIKFIRVDTKGASLPIEILYYFNNLCQPSPPPSSSVYSAWN